MTPKKTVNRRNFLQASGLAAGRRRRRSLPAPGHRRGVKGANERLNFAIVGPGGRAQGHIGHLLEL